jgi:Fe-S oxidoreductase/nitrate reductase gamma subunit
MNDQLDLATREIMWNIPPSFKYAMYALLVLSAAYMFKGLYEKALFVANQNGVAGLKGLKGLLPEKLNWEKFLKTILFTDKVSRDPFVAVFHSLIFYGFVILWIATDLVAIHFDTPFKVFQGTTYIVISFLADIAGLAILVGIALAFYRRYILKPAYLSSSKPKQELFMYAILVNLVVVGYFIEGLRILGTNMPMGEQYWSPVGWLLARFFSVFSLNDSVLALAYRALWFLHMVSTMVFVASIGHSKFFHIISAPLGAILTPYRRGGVISPMNFEDENAETFGLGKLSELTLKNRFDMLSCVECGRCTQVCPAQNSGKNLDPKKIITKIRDFALSEKAEGRTDSEIFAENPLYQSNELDACTTCGACMEECPVNIEHVPLIMEAKRYKVLTLGDIPAPAADTVTKIKVNGNPWGITQEDRFKWADGLDVPVVEAGKPIDYLYYVGCAGSYDASSQKVVRDTVTLLKKAGVNFAVMGKTEKCNGDPIRRFGDEYSFFEVAIENIANMRQYQFQKVVTHCPHCLHTIGKEYAKFEDGQFETIHHTELLADLLKSGKLKAVKEVQDELTFHDPCYLGRHHGEYDAPREILKSIPGLKIKEMEKSKDKSVCCGMGGGNMWYELPEGQDLALNRLEQIGETKSNKLATACSYCLINFNSSKAKVASTEQVDIQDVATYLAQSVE